jgi:hypothetical protein
MENTISCDMTPYRPVGGDYLLVYCFIKPDLENGGSTFIRNVDKLPKDYKSSHPRS